MVAKKWFIKLICLCCVFLIAMATVTCLYDPLMLYKDSDQKLLVNSRYSIPGVIKHKNYDTAIIGSSMAENVKLDELRENIEWNPITLTRPAMYITELEEILKLSYEEEAYERYIISIDVFSLKHEEQQESRFQAYMFDNNFLNDYEYWWGYSTWTTLLPIDIGINTLEAAGVELPSKIYEKTDLDYMGYWAHLYDFNEDSVKSFCERTRETGDDIVNIGSEITLNIETAKNNIDYIFSTIDSYCKGKDVNLYIPPYSALYLLNMKENNEYNAYMDIRKYIATEANKRENIFLYDFQSSTDIWNLDNYYDYIHPSPEVMTAIMKSIYNEEERVTLENIEEKNQEVEENINKLIEAHYDWLKEIELVE